jgi:hypothetical protein
VIAAIEGCKSGSAKDCGGGGDLMGICDGGGLSATVGSCGRRFVGRGRLAGAFDDVSTLGPAVFLEDVGIEGSCLGSDGSVPLVLPAGCDDFVWKIEKVRKYTH